MTPEPKIRKAMAVLAEAVEAIEEARGALPASMFESAQGRDSVRIISAAHDALTWAIEGLDSFDDFINILDRVNRANRIIDSAVKEKENIQ